MNFAYGFWYPLYLILVNNSCVCTGKLRNIINNTYVNDMSKRQCLSQKVKKQISVQFIKIYKNYFNIAKNL